MWPGANASPCETMEHGPPDFLRGEGLQIGRAPPRLRLESDEDLRALPESGQNLGRRGEFEGDCPLARWDLALRLFRREVADCSGDDADVRLHGGREGHQVLRRFE